MTVTQYIGAMYIPHGWTEWKSATAYDGMAVVSYNMMWYIAKQPVPVGYAPTGQMDDPYWAPVDRWNGQIEEYRKQLVTLTSSDNRKDILNLITLGDSYGAPEFSWATLLPCNSLYNASIAGSSFNASPGYPSYFDQLKSVPTEKILKASHVLLFAGYNDYIQHTPLVTIESQLKAMRDYVLGINPHIKLLTGFIASSLTGDNFSSIRYLWKIGSINACWTFCPIIGITNDNYMLNNNHPNNPGYQYLAYQIQGYINNSVYELPMENTDTLSPIGNATAINPNGITCVKMQDFISVTFNSNIIALSSKLENNVQTKFANIEGMTKVAKPFATNIHIYTAAQLMPAILTFDSVSNLSVRVYSETAGDSFTIMPQNINIPYNYLP